MKLTTSAPATRTAALAADTVLSPVLSGRKGAHGGTSVHASLFLVVALATTPRPVPEGCARGGPLVAVASMPGLGPGPLGVIVAVWANGRILRARDPMDPAREATSRTASHPQAWSKFLPSSSQVTGSGSSLTWPSTFRSSSRWFALVPNGCGGYRQSVSQPRRRRLASSSSS